MNGVTVASERYTLVAVDVLRDQRLSISARLLFALLKSFANYTQVSAENPANSTFVSKQRLAEEMGREQEGEDGQVEVKAVSTRAIENWLAELEAVGYLTVERRKIDKRNLPNRYHLDDGVVLRAAATQAANRERRERARTEPDPWGRQPAAAGEAWL